MANVHFHRIRPCTLCVAVTLTGAGCAGAPPAQPAGARVESAGIEIVLNRGPDRPLDWSFEKVLDLGAADDGPQAFSRVSMNGVGTDGAGRIYVLDSGNYVVTVFDETGGVVRQMGGQGGGPGEFQFPTDLAVTDAGAVAVWDFGKVGLVSFGSSGAILPERKIQGALQRQIATTPIGTIGAFRTFSDGANEAGHTRLLAIGNEDTISFATRTNEPEPIVQFDCMAFTMAPLLTPDIVWSARGDRVVANNGQTVDMAVFEGEQLVARWRRDLAVIPASAELAAQELGGDSLRMMAGTVRCAIAGVEAVDKIGYQAIVPPVRSIAIARDGWVWVRRRTAGVGEFPIDVFEPVGTYLGTLPPGTPFPSAFRGADEIVVVERDALDLPHVIVFRIVRGKGLT